MSIEPNAAPTRDLESDKRLTHVLYILHALAPFTALMLAVIAVVLGMARRDDVRGTFLESHFAWLSRTFWWGFLWLLVCGVLFALLFISIIGWLILWLPYFVLALWYFYRVIKGWMRLNDGRPVE